VRDPALQPSVTVTNHPRGHRDTLSRRDSLEGEIGESLKPEPLDSIAEEAERQVPDAIVTASLER
jgi:hypothetical protein